MKRTYEIPRALDIATSTLSGQKVKPLGVCAGGSSPTSFTCAGGTNPVQADLCSPIGSIPFVGGCAAGTNATQLCSAGSFPT